MIKLEYGDLAGMKSEFQGVRDLSAFRHFEIGVLGVGITRVSSWGSVGVGTGFDDVMS